MEKATERKFNTIDEAAEALRQGEIIVVIDDPDRENEGDLICAARYATTANVNFMACYGKGLICMPMSAEMTRRSGPDGLSQYRQSQYGVYSIDRSCFHYDRYLGHRAFHNGYEMCGAGRQTGGFPPSRSHVSP